VVLAAATDLPVDRRSPSPDRGHHIN